MLADCTAIARRSRVAVAIRFASAPIIRCCAAVGGSAALRMRHTPCGCRSAHLVEVLTNFRLPIVPTNAASAAMPLFRKQSAAVLPSLAPHDSKARLLDVSNRRDSWRSHVHRTRTAQRVQLFKPQAGHVGGRGVLPSRSLGGLRGPFSHVREWPPLFASPVQRREIFTPPVRRPPHRQKTPSTRDRLWRLARQETR